MNWGYILAVVSCLLTLAIAVGYAFAHDWRKALYFFFAFCITLTVIWK